MAFYSTSEAMIERVTGNTSQELRKSVEDHITREDEGRFAVVFFPSEEISMLYCLTTRYPHLLGFLPAYSEVMPKEGQNNMPLVIVVNVASIHILCNMLQNHIPLHQFDNAFESNRGLREAQCVLFLGPI